MYLCCIIVYSSLCASFLRGNASTRPCHAWGQRGSVNKRKRQRGCLAGRHKVLWTLHCYMSVHGLCAFRAAPRKARTIFADLPCRRCFEGCPVVNIIESCKRCCQQKPSDCTFSWTVSGSHRRLGFGSSSSAAAANAQGPRCQCFHCNTVQRGCHAFLAWLKTHRAATGFGARWAQRMAARATERCPHPQKQG